jgi:hypothetical protein
LLIKTPLSGIDKTERQKEKESLPAEAAIELKNKTEHLHPEWV